MTGLIEILQLSVGSSSYFISLTLDSGYTDVLVTSWRRLSDSGSLLQVDVEVCYLSQTVLYESCYACDVRLLWFLPVTSDYRGSYLWRQTTVVPTCDVS